MLHDTKEGVSQAACGLFSYAGRSGDVLYLYLYFAEMSSVKNYVHYGGYTVEAQTPRRSEALFGSGLVVKTL